MHGCLPCCRELNSMDVVLYQAGKRQLLRRRQDLHAAHKLERLPHLQTRESTLQSHRRPAANSDLQSPGLPLHPACDASASGFGHCTRFVSDSSSNAHAACLPHTAASSGLLSSFTIFYRVVLCTSMERRQCTAGIASKDTIRDEL